MKVAVVGSGVAGLGATWALNEHSEHEVHLFESSAHHIGGHSNTVSFRAPSGAKSGAGETPVDTGFIVFNEVTYPNFLRFLTHIEAPILVSDMSFAVSRAKALEEPSFQLPFSRSYFPSLPRHIRSNNANTRKERGAFEWAGSTPLALFCQWSNLFDPSHWRMIWDIIRFNHQSIESLREWEASEVTDAQAEAEEETIGQWLDQRRYGPNFRRNYLIPMTASIWSTPPKTAFGAFPARTLLRFLHNHHLLQILNHPQWLTIQGGSKTYVERVLQKLPRAQLHQGQESGHVVKAFPGIKGKWIIERQGGKTEEFDRVVFACHADVTTEILAADEAMMEKDEIGVQLKRCLKEFKFSKNTAVLHSDETLMPVRRFAWSAWNFMAESSEQDFQDDVDSVTLTYWMNLLQSLSEDVFGPVLVTLNPPKGTPDPAKVVASFDYEHPLYTSKSVRAQAALESLQGKWRGARFAGAWTNYGFHEDGFSSGVRAAVALGAKVPFEVRPAERSLPHSSRIRAATFLLAERIREAIAGPACLILAPFIVICTLVLEAIMNAFTFLLVGPASPSATRNELRNVRKAWEKSLLL